MGDDWVVVTTADRRDDVRLLLYGLSLRGLRAESRRRQGRGPDPWEIVVPPEQADLARRTIGAVWDAVFEAPRAVTPQGHCPFCGYLVLGLPAGRPCPECGVDLESVAARRAWRSGAKPR